MTKLVSAAAYMLQRMDGDDTFNVDRLFKLLYLVDWRASLEGSDPLTSLVWTSRGPTSLVAELDAEDSSLIEALKLFDGQTRTARVASIVTESARGLAPLQPTEQAVCDFVLEHAGRRAWSDLNDLVWSTRPLLTAPSHGDLDLPAIAEHQRAEREAHLELA